jgi:hypothetical protein
MNQMFSFDVRYQALGQKERREKHSNHGITAMEELIGPLPGPYHPGNPSHLPFNLIYVKGRELSIPV